METTKITLELTHNELYDLAYALQETIERNIKDDRLPMKYWKDGVEAECKLLYHFVRYHSYSMSMPGNDLKDYKEYNDVDEWVEALIAQKNAEK